MPAVGLQFDLGPWKKGIRDAGTLVKKGISAGLLRPFDVAVKRTGAAMRATFSKVGGFIKGVLSSAFAPLLALFAVAKILSTIKNVLTGSLAAYRAYSDSATTLQAALRTLGDGVDVSAAKEQVKGLGDQLRLAMGITGTEVNAAFATMITRGFDLREARQLTILAANYAKKSGKPIADVTKMIADAANGSVDAMKELGVQIGVTGNAVTDGEAAVRALKSAYGDIGGELANPSERLAAAWNELAVSLGEKISPIIEPLVQGFSDFVTGLSETEEGQAMLAKIADTLRSIVDWTMTAAMRVGGFVQTVISGSQVVYHTLREVLLKLSAEMTDLFMKNPLFKWASGKLGFDGEAWSKSLREMTKESARASAEAMSGWEEGFATMTGPAPESRLLESLKNIQEAGKTAREEAKKALDEEMAATRDEAFAGRVAQEKQAAIDEKARQAQMAKQQQRLSGYGAVGSGNAVSVRIVNVRPDRWRRARVR